MHVVQPGADREQHAVAEELERRRQIRPLSEVPQFARHRLQFGLDGVDVAGRARDEHQPAAVGRHRGRHEHRRVDEADALRGHAREALRRLLGQRRRVIDHDGAGFQCRHDLVEDAIDDGVVGQHEVDVIHPGDTLGGRRGDDRAFRLERAALAACGSRPSPARRLRKCLAIPEPSSPVPSKATRVCVVIVFNYAAVRRLLFQSQEGQQRCAIATVRSTKARPARQRRNHLGPG